MESFPQSVIHVHASCCLSVSVGTNLVLTPIWDDIERQIERLRDFPRSGRIGRMPETRELVVSGTPYIVVYLVSDDVELIRVLHGAQKWPPEN